MIDFTRYPNNVLPLPLLKTHSLKRKSMRLESKMDSGYSRSRRRFKNPPSEMAVSFLFSNDQQEIFEGWYHDIINAGTSWFVMPVKVGSVVADHECKFIGDYSQKSPSKNLWTISAKLLVKNLRVISANETLGRIHDLPNMATSVRDGLDEAVTNYVNEG
jgi:hypothetical protein